MSLSKVTILSFEDWLNNERKSLFDFMDIPEGIDKETLTNNILLQAAEFELLYSNPYSMRDYIKIWSKKHYRTFDKWIKLLNMDYNPIENYDRIEEWDEKRKGTTKDNTTGKSDTRINTESTSVTDNKYNTYDSDTLKERAQDVNTSDSANSQIVNSSADSTSDHDDNLKHSGRIHGNIGVMTTQQMAQSEIEYARFNIYDQITDLFMQEFCLMVYV